MLDSAVADLCEEYPEMFKPSLRCKPPHLHEAIFRDDIFQSEVITRRGLKTAAELREFMLSANKDYSPRSDSQWEQIVLDSKLFKSSGKSLSEAIKKARANKFYLGLDNSWMHQS